MGRFGGAGESRGRRLEFGRCRRHRLDDDAYGTTEGVSETSQCDIPFLDGAHLVLSLFVFETPPFNDVLLEHFDRLAIAPISSELSREGTSTRMSPAASRCIASVIAATGPMIMRAMRNAINAPITSAKPAATSWSAMVLSMAPSFASRICSKS